MVRFIVRMRLVTPRAEDVWGPPPIPGACTVRSVASVMPLGARAPLREQRRPQLLRGVDRDGQFAPKASATFQRTVVSICILCHACKAIFGAVGSFSNDEITK